MKKVLLGMTVVAAFASAGAVQAASCRIVHWKPDTILNVNSAMYLGTRIELPADIVTDPVPSSDLWNAEGAANQVVIKPNSDTPQGSSVVVRIWTKDGNAYDVVGNRSAASANETCVKIVANGMTFTPGARAALNSQSFRAGQGGADFAAELAQKNAALSSLRQNAEEEKKAAVVEALRRFRYHVYTRYQWDQGKGFAAQNLISDVYDDGRFTYVRLFQPNRGLMSVETEVGGKNAVVPTKYDDAYGMYVITGIYPKFTLRVDKSEINISRSDSKTNGEF